MVGMARAVAFRATAEPTSLFGGAVTSTLTPSLIIRSAIAANFVASPSLFATSASSPSALMASCSSGSSTSFQRAEPAGSDTMTPTLISGRAESSPLPVHPVMVTRSPIAAASAVRLVLRPIVAPRHPPRRNQQAGHQVSSPSSVTRFQQGTQSRRPGIDRTHNVWRRRPVDRCHQPQPSLLYSCRV